MGGVSKVKTLRNYLFTQVKLEHFYKNNSPVSFLCFSLSLGP